MSKIRLHNGLNIYYEVTDFVDPWLVPETVVLHHGLGKSGRFWLPWVRLLSGHFRVVTIDMLGNGRSSRPRGHRWSIAGYASDALEVLDALGLKQVHFVGEAVGGCVGLQLGACHASRLLTLTLSACPYRPVRPEGGTGDLRTDSREIARHGLAEVTDRELPSRLDWSRYPPEMYAWYRKERLSASARIVSEQRAAQAAEDIEWTLPLITPPTLLIIPGSSPVSSTPQMREMARLIPHVRAVEFPEEGAWVTFAQADACVAAFLSFVSENPTAGRGDSDRAYRQALTASGLVLGAGSSSLPFTDQDASRGEAAEIRKWHPEGGKIKVPLIPKGCYVSPPIAAVDHVNGE
jgi:pimeloyl-ACP methyl ester carboxylesterase